MTNPDLPVYVDLTLYDANERDLVDAAIAAIRVRMPQWQPREGNTEVLLIEALALLIGQEVYALNRLPTVVFDALLMLDGLERQPALPATGQIRLTLASSTGSTRTVQPGTRFRVRLDAVSTVDVLTVELVSVNPSNGPTADLWVVVDEPGARYNGTPAGTPADIVDSLPWVESAALASPLAGGQEPEPDNEFYARGAAYRRRVTQTLVTADQFAGAALDVVGVSRARAVGAYNSANPQSQAGTNLGHLTVALAGEDGAAVPAAVKTTVAQILTGLAVAGLAVHVVDRDVQAVNIQVAVQIDATADVAAVQAGVVAQLAAWLDPDSWDWGRDITVNDIVVQAGAVPGVRRVTNVVSNVGAASLFTLPAKPATLACTATR